MRLLVLPLVRDYTRNRHAVLHVEADVIDVTVRWRRQSVASDPGRRTSSPETPISLNSGIYLKSY